MKLTKVAKKSDSTPKVAFKSEKVETQSANTPAPEEIRRRAFEIYIERGGIHGRDIDDWLQAERELKAKFQPTENSNPQTRRLHA